MIVVHYISKTKEYCQILVMTADIQLSIEATKYYYDVEKIMKTRILTKAEIDLIYLKTWNTVWAPMPIIKEDRLKEYKQVTSNIDEDE